MVEVADISDMSNHFGDSLRGTSMDLLNINTSSGMDDVDKLLQAFQPGERALALACWHRERNSRELLPAH